MNCNIASLIFTLIFLIVAKVSAYVVEVIKQDTSDKTEGITPPYIIRYDEDQIVSTFEYMVSRFTFEELCVRIGGLVGEDGNCINTNKGIKSKSTKTIPYEYRDIHWHINQYPKTFTNFSLICRELIGGTLNDMGICVPKTTEPPKQVSSTVIAITTKAPPASLTVETTLPIEVPNSVVETNQVIYATTTKMPPITTTKILPITTTKKVPLDSI